MPTASEEYKLLRGLTEEALGPWVEDRYPDGAPAQWWNSLLESVESEILHRLHRSEPVDGSPYRFASSLMHLAQNSLDLGHKAHWLLRLSVLADRSCTASTELPTDVTTNGAVRYALSAIQLSMDQAILLARIRNQALYDDDAPLRLSDAQLHALQELELIAPALDWVRDRITNDRLREAVREWLATYDLMAPGSS